MNVPHELQIAGERVRPALRAAIESLPPSISDVVGDHMGWLDREGAPTEARGSKSIRPGLSFLSARAIGVDPEVALPGSVAVELINNASFLHDDVMDGDRHRRQRETAWVVFGIDRAVCAGDALFLLAPSVVATSASPGRQAATHLVHETILSMVAGQADDLVLRPDELTVDQWLDMAYRKTGSLVGCATSIGAVLGAGPDPTVTGLGKFGRHLGVAFQVVDDMLGVWGQPAQTGGRPPGFDVRARRPTLPMVAALASGDAHAGELQAILDAAELTDADVARGVDLIERCGGYEASASLVERLRDEAGACLSALSLPAEVEEAFLTFGAVGLPEVVMSGSTPR